MGKNHGTLTQVIITHIYLCHAVTGRDTLSCGVDLLYVELSEEVEGNDSVEVDHNTCP